MGASLMETCGVARTVRASNRICLRQSSTPGQGGEYAMQSGSSFGEDSSSYSAVVPCAIGCQKLEFAEKVISAESCLKDCVSAGVLAHAGADLNCLCTECRKYET